MKTLLVTTLAVLIMLTTFASAGQAHKELVGSHLKFDTIEELPRPQVDISVSGEGKAKSNFEFVFEPFYSYQLIDNQGVIITEPHYHLPNHHLLRAKSYFLII